MTTETAKERIALPLCKHRGLDARGAGVHSCDHPWTPPELVVTDDWCANKCRYVNDVVTPPPPRPTSNRLPPLKGTRAERRAQRQAQRAAQGVILQRCGSCQGNVRLKTPAPRGNVPADDHGQASLSAPLPPAVAPPAQPSILTWACGVTTVPERLDNLLQQTLASLRSAGFDAPHLFVDGPGDSNATTTCRGERLMPYGNWMLALWEMWVRHPYADRYVIFQDDVIAVKNLRQYLDRCAFPEKGYWNLYTVPGNQAAINAATSIRGWHELPPERQKGLGALGLVFSNPGVHLLLKTEPMIQKPKGEFRGGAWDRDRAWRTIDGAVVEAMTSVGWKEWCHNPSLLQHTGRWSTFDKRVGADGRQKEWPPYRWEPNQDATSFPGETFDAMELLR